MPAIQLARRASPSIAAMSVGPPVTTGETKYIDRVMAAVPSSPPTNALDILGRMVSSASRVTSRADPRPHAPVEQAVAMRSEEHTSDLQSLRHLVCRLLPD